MENDRRALNVFAGMRRAQKEGRWMATAPLGYMNHLSTSGKKIIAPDPHKGPIMQWAFKQLATGQFNVESIYKEALKRGLRSAKSPFWLALRNPVYCGKIRVKAYKNEEEQIVIGQHQPLITETLFYQVQEVLAGRKRGYLTNVSGDNRFPLRGYLQCPQCGKLLTASASKGRNAYYSYYHCTLSCRVRFSTDAAENALMRELARWKPHFAFKHLYGLVLQDIYRRQLSTRNQELQKIKAEIERLSKRKIEARELRLSNDLDTDDYRQIKRECEQAIARCESQLVELSSSNENIDKLMGPAIEVLSNLDLYYKKGDIEVKRQLVGSIYPEKLVFTGERFRTTKVNEAVQLIYSIGPAFEEIKKGQVASISDLSLYVDP